MVSSARAGVCVLIASHNEAGALPLTLAALRSQTDAPECIVVVDDGSSDATGVWLSAEHGIAAPPLGQLSAAAAAWRWVPFFASAVAGSVVFCKRSTAIARWPATAATAGSAR